MNKKILAIILSFSLILGFLAGCSSQDQKNTEVSKETFDTALCKNTWEAEVFGYKVSISFKPDGTGHIEAAGASKDFNYSLSETTVDPMAGDITISGTGLTEVDGKTIHAVYSGTNMVVSYQGMEYTFTPPKS